jgi:IclR family KDG regulon transcriptional repressor
MVATRTEPGRDDRAAVDKAFSLLVAFGDDAGAGLGVSELARRTGLSKSTAFRVLGMLERNKMVERIGTGYRLGARLQELGRAANSPQQDHVRDLLMPYVIELFEVTRHTVHLAVLQGLDVLYLAKLYGHRTVGVPSRIDGRLPATCTGVGKALLAYSPNDAAKSLALPLRQLTPYSILDADALTLELAEVRSVGVATERDESRIGVQCVAAPVLGRNGRPWAALSVSAPTSSDLRAATSSLRQVCASAATALQRGALVRSA